MKRVRVIPLILSIVIPLLVGGISAFLSMTGMSEYASMNKPPLSPPAWLFPIVWTILYILMGLASYFVFVSESEKGCKVAALVSYGVQLLMNFMWPIAFFVWKLYLFAFVWLIVMWVVVIFCTVWFFRICKGAGCLMIPYILWLTFAACLNLGTYIINR